MGTHGSAGADSTEQSPPEDLYRYDRTPNKRVPTLDAITEEDLGFFQQHGYLVIDSLLTNDEINRVKEGMVDLLDRMDSEDSDIPDTVVQIEETPDEHGDLESLPPAERINYIRKFWKFSEFSDAMAAPARRDDLLDLLTTLIDDQPTMFQDMALVKPPGGSEKPWHQDKAYFELELDAPVVGVWIAIDEATAENGCMHIVPGSHREGPVVHFDRRDWQICDTDVQTEKDVMVPLDPGGALLFDGLLHHGTPPNESTQNRRALQFHYTGENATWLDDGHAAFGATGKDVSC